MRVKEAANKHVKAEHISRAQWLSVPAIQRTEMILAWYRVREGRRKERELDPLETHF